jgi:hypothetical protein
MLSWKTWVDMPAYLERLDLGFFLPHGFMCLAQFRRHLRLAISAVQPVV